MSFLFELDEDKLAEQLPDIFAKYEAKVQNAAPLFDLEGQRLEMLLRELPKHQAHYDHRAQEMKQLMKWLENFKAKTESRLLKNYNGGRNQVFSARDVTTMIGGEKDIVELNQLIIEATLLYEQLDSIVEGFKTMNWTLGYVTKLRISELQETII